MITDAYRDKVIFMTGATGFVGKVVLEKLFYSVRHFRKIYLLIRPKPNVDPIKRMQKEILNSKWFDRCRETIPMYSEYLAEKVFPIEGDISEDNLGMKSEDWNLLAEEVDVIFNIAASVDFIARLDINMRINTRGAMNILQLAKACSKIQVLCQISTAYANSQKPKGPVEETIDEDDVEKLESILEEVLQMSPEEVEEKQHDILGNFPNTYTYSKNVCEKLLRKYRGDLPLVIIRPSMIGAAAEEPHIGWVDSVSATTAVYLAASIGVLKDLYGNSGIIGDEIPVDYVAHTMIVAAAENMNKNKLMVYHSGTSCRNPCTGEQMTRYYWKYLGRNQFESRIAPPTFDTYTNKTLYDAIFLLKRKLPAKALYYFSKLIGNQKLKSDAERYIDALDKCNMIGILFSHFANVEWIFETYNIYQVMQKLPEEDLNTYLLEVKNIKWKEYFINYAYGIQKFILREDVEPPFEGRGNFINTRPMFLSDLMFVFYKGKFQATREHSQILKMILQTDKVRIAVRTLAEADAAKSALSEPKRLAIQQDKVAEILDRMAARLNNNKMRMLGYIIHKAYKRMYEKVVINRGALEKIGQLTEKKEGNVVYCPTHRSYVDFLILSYVLFAHKIKVPHICAGEDFLNIAVVHSFLRSSGAFFMRRSFKDDILYKAVFYEYVQLLLSDNHSLEFFVEGTRARSGKMLSPKFGLLNILTNSYFWK